MHVILNTKTISKNNFYIIRLKKLILPCIFFSFVICLVLFPFFVATELLSQTNAIYLLGKLLNNFMKPLFNVRGEGSFALIMGIISGYPVGAKIACNFRENNICSKEECERLLSFTNNSGPLFIIGTVGISMFGSSTIGLLLFITHFLASITVGIIFRFWKYNRKYSNFNINKNTNFSSNTSNIHLSNLGEVLANSITNSISTIMMIGGFVVLFSVIISILKSSQIVDFISSIFVPVFNAIHLPTSFISPIITGFLEITNGISGIANIPMKQISINIILAAFLLGLGGISIFLQVLSITSKTDLSIRPYLYGKILHGIIAAFYTYLFIYYFPIFNLNL